MPHRFAAFQPHIDMLRLQKWPKMAIFSEKWQFWAYFQVPYVKLQFHERLKGAPGFNLQFHVTIEEFQTYYEEKRAEKHSKIPIENH